MLIGGILLGLLLGLVLGGKIERLADIRLQYLPLLFVAVIIRFGTEALLGMGVGFVDVLRIPLYGLSYGLLLFTLWHNRTYPGLALAFIGIALNGLVIMVNGGRMPVWMDAYAFAGLTGPLNSVLHVPLYEVNPEFFLRLGPLADVIPLPIPPLQNVASIGDLFLSAGLAFFLFATLLRSPADAQRALDEAREDRLLGVAGTARLRAPGTGVRATAPGTIPASTGLSPALEETAALERPLLLGSSSTGQAAPTYGRLPDGTLVATTIEAVPRRRASVLTRVRRHPYVRLALNGSFSALWVGQLISMFGDRVNQIALLFFVFETTKSPLQVALVFVAGSLPNLLFSPVAGALVDRWDQKQVLVVSDILRAALVLLVPVTISINVWIAYVLVFLITTVSIFFRPARIAILPRIVDDTDLLPANSAMWVGETIADVVNYPLAGLFVLFLGSSAALAFWFDAVTYLASAGLLATMVVPPVVRRARSASAAGRLDDLEPEAEPSSGGVPSVADVRRDLNEGWAFLRTEAVLLANTVQSTAAQLAVGVVTGLGFLIAGEVNPATQTATFAFMETAIGVGNLLGGFALGLVTARIAKGRLIIAAYASFGVLVFLVGFIPPLPIMLALMFGIGIANMAFVIPSQTLFQERTPPELMARVVSLRFAIVFGVMTVATFALGLVANVTGVGPVVALAGLIAVVAGLAGMFVPAIRDA